MIISNKKISWLKMSVFLLSVLFLLTSCQAKTNTATKLNIAYFPNITHSQALLGKSTNAFEDAIDMDIQWHAFNAGPSEIEAIFAGAVDIGYIGPIPAINGFITSQGDVTIIAGATDGGAVLVAGALVKMTDAADLDGKKVAVPQFGNTQHLSLLHLLRENGLTTTDKGGTVEVVQAENADIKTLLDNGTIDCALVPEPWGARLTHELDARIILDEKQLWRDGDYPVAVVVVRTEFLNQYPEVVTQFLDVHVQMTEYILNHETEAAIAINEQIEELTGQALSNEVLLDAFRRIQPTYSLAEEATLEFMALLAAEGYIENTTAEGLFSFDLLYSVIQ